MLWQSSRHLLSAALLSMGGMWGAAHGLPQGGTPVTPTRNPLRLAVLRLGLTEPAWTSPLNREKRRGVYACAGCGSALFSSEGKYDSGSGWPSYSRSIGDGAIRYKREWDGRVEVRCLTCDGHLGHAFGDGPRPVEGETVPATDLAPANGRRPRFCINGLALSFVPEPLSDSEEPNGESPSAD
jgi:peptide-methionine (R)-S-oxide reductase